MPCGPSGPETPCGPCGPETPCGPCGPAGPCGPCLPVLLLSLLLSFLSSSNLNLQYSTEPTKKPSNGPV